MTFTVRGLELIAPDGTQLITITSALLWFDSPSVYCMSCERVAIMVADLLNKLMNGDIPNLAFADYLEEEE